MIPPFISFALAFVLAFAPLSPRLGLGLEQNLGLEQTPALEQSAQTAQDPPAAAPATPAAPVPTVTQAPPAVPAAKAPSASAKAQTLGFAGLWKTSFGRMRLSETGGEYVGTYSYGAISKVEGKMMPNGRLKFRYSEPNASGDGWFELNEDKQSFHGKWREDGSNEWLRWSGQRVKPRKNQTWLVVLEAHWESGLSEPEYSFGAMLRSYFSMADARHINVRHRYFHDEFDLRRFCRETVFLAEPVILVISTHGSKEGLSVAGMTLPPKSFATALRHAHNVKLLHLSGCDMMSGSMPNEIHDRLADGAQFPISGYKTTVAWDASALGDFTFLSLILMHGMAPDEAAKQAIKLSPFLGEVPLEDAAFESLGLTVVPPQAPVLIASPASGQL